MCVCVCVCVCVKNTQYAYNAAHKPRVASVALTLVREGGPRAVVVKHVDITRSHTWGEF